MDAKRANKLNARYRRTSWEVHQKRISDIAKILDSNLAGEEAIGRQVAQDREKLNALAQAGVLNGILSVRDSVENFCLLFRGTVEVTISIFVGTR